MCEHYPEFRAVWEEKHMQPKYTVQKPISVSSERQQKTWQAFIDHEKGQAQAVCINRQGRKAGLVYNKRWISGNSDQRDRRGLETLQERVFITEAIKKLLNFFTKHHDP